MSQFVSFMEATAGMLSDFLMDEPCIYFVALFIMAWLAKIFATLIYHKN